MDKPTTDEPLDPRDQAEALLLEGDLIGALRLTEELSPEDPERWLLAAEAWTDLGEFGNADAALGKAAELGEEDAWWTFVRGRWLLAQWRADEARETFERLDPADEGAALLANLALAADIQGDFEAADRFLENAHVLEPEVSPLPPRLDPERFEELVAAAAQELPPAFRAALEQSAVVIDAMPTRAIVGAPASGHPPDILGLFTGVPFHERDTTSPGELPPTIYLFQRNLERLAVDEAHLAEEIRVTLFHELGHALGFDEDGVDELGLA